jgi:hypothetical protein
MGSGRGTMGKQWWGYVYIWLITVYPLSQSPSGHWYSKRNCVIICIITINFETLMQMNTVNSVQSHLSISASALEEKRNRKFEFIGMVPLEVNVYVFCGIFIKLRGP